ncbi:MAG: hypothetical protein K8I82_31695 [Anaerolineae bacterium]|nr:hypothetical protein [Anaerolineae bacterium]
MVAIQVSESTYQKLRERAEKVGRTIEDVILDSLTFPTPQELAAIEQHIREVLTSPDSETRQKLYALCRRYWLAHHDYERLKLTDAELDEQFWLIDPQGIPRLKSEQGQIEIPPDPLEEFLGLFSDSEITDASVTVHETVGKYYQDKYGRTD